MDSPGEISSLCRLCLVKDQVNIPIFEEQGDIRQIFLKISSCLPVKVSRDDNLPKNICDGCSNKLDLFYDFWSSSASAEKTLLSWLGETDAEEKIDTVAQQIAKSTEARVKLESEADPSADIFEESPSSFDEGTKDETEAPPAKRVRRSAAVKAQINIAPDSEDDDEMDSAEPLTKLEDESEDSDGEEKDPSYAEVPGTSADDDQAGPSGVGKDGVEAPRGRSRCQICQRQFSSKQQLERHLTNLSIQLESKCSLCENTKTQCKHREDEKSFYCEFCNIEILPPFTAHMCFHLKKPKCHTGTTKRRSKTLKRKEMLRNNKPLDLFLSDYDDLDICIYCNKEMSSSLLSKHESWHRKYDKTVKSLIDPESTSRSKKNGDGLCAYCGVLKPNNKLRRHEYVEHLKKNVRKVCDVCGIFTCPTYIKEHMRTHDAVKSFKCDDCGKAFFRKKALSRHRLVHSDVAQYSCHVCGKSFKIRFNLRVHMRSHEDVKPFACSVCKKTFTTKQWRDNHLKTHGIIGNK